MRRIAKGVIGGGGKGEQNPQVPWGRPRRPELTPEQHAADLADRAARMIQTKYLAGQREHGGRLWLKQGLIDMAIEEAVDQVIYLLTLRDQIRAAGVTLGEIAEPAAAAPERPHDWY